MDGLEKAMNKLSFGIKKSTLPYCSTPLQSRNETTGRIYMKFGTKVYLTSGHKRYKKWTGAPPSAPGVGEILPVPPPPPWSLKIYRVEYLRTQLNEKKKNIEGLGPLVKCMTVDPKVMGSILYPPSPPPRVKVL